MRSGKVMRKAKPEYLRPDFIWIGMAA